MGADKVTVYRRVETDGVVVEECASAALPDDLALDDLTEALRRGSLARSLFAALPGVQAEAEARYQRKQAAHGKN